jgi:hypothetical protein
MVAIKEKLLSGLSQEVQIPTEAAAVKILILNIYQILSKNLCL